MLRILVARELLDKAKQGWLLKVFLPCILLSLGCALLQARDLQERLQSHSLLLNNPEMSASELPVLFEPQAMSVFAKGLDVQKGTNHIINPLPTLFSSLDFVRLVEIFLGLLAILTSSVLISYEKEQGTLRLVLSNSIPKSVVIAAKWASLLLLFGIILGTMFLTFLLSTLSTGIVQLGATHWVCLGLLFGASLLYIAVFLSAGVFFSVTCASSSRATIVALLFWAIALFVVPTGGFLVGKAWTHPPKLETVLQSQYRATQQLRLEASRRRITWDVYAKRVREVKEKLDAEYQHRLNNYVNVSQAIMRLSPSASYVFAATALAGTGLYSWQLKRGIIEREKPGGGSEIHAGSGLN